MVEVESVYKSFGAVCAVGGISFELRPGQVAGLLGPNGAGKTTTIRMIAGYYMPDYGRVVINGFDTALQPAAARRQLGYMPESTPLYGEMRIREYLHYRGTLHGMARAARKRAAEFAMDRCRILDVSRQRIGTLSKGYKQRVGLAAALMHSPRVLILDEPTNGLDPTQMIEVRQLVRDLSAERTMLISSHILSEVERLCDRMIVIAGGRVRADGTAAEISALAGITRRYVVQARITRHDDVQRFEDLMRNIPFLAKFDRSRGNHKDGEWMEWSIEAKEAAPDMREAIATAAQHVGIMLRELRGTTASLEHAFARLVEGTVEVPAGQVMGSTAGGTARPGKSGGAA